LSAIGITRHHFFECERADERNGLRKALGARRRTILPTSRIDRALHARWFDRPDIAYLMCFLIGKALSFPIKSRSAQPGSLRLRAYGLVAFAPAWSASRLDPVTALRYE
jgi:hypothetical protein